MARFMYSAKVVGVGANFGGPNGLQQFWASRALPIIGGVDPPRGEDGPSAHPVLNFGFAETQLSGREIDPVSGLPQPGTGFHETVIRTTVENLNIFPTPGGGPLDGAITARLVSVTVTWRCNLANGDRTVVVTGANGQNPFVDLRINGALVNVNLDAPGALPGGASTPDDTLADLAARNYPLFRAQLPLNRPPGQPQRRPGAHLTHPPKDGAAAPFHTAFTHLVQLPNAQINVDPGPPLEFGRFIDLNPDPRIERVYLCQWFADPDRQNLTIMRIKLAAPNAGEIVICDPDDDGRDYP